MAEGNVERFQEIARQWQENRRVEPELLASDVEWVNPPEAVEPGTRRGVDGFNDAIASVFEGWEESRFEPVRVIETGDHVVALGEIRARGRMVGAEVRAEHGQVWTFRRDGRVASMRWFNTHREALEAAGLPAD